MISSWKNPWREELNGLFLPLSLFRRPALRRSPRPDYLFSTDLPSFASPADCALFLERASALGWESVRLRGWLHLWKTSAPPPAGWFPPNPVGEAACLRALLRRHPGRADARDALILLLKAREEGPEAWESACRRLHQDFARRLREGASLPRLPMEEETTEEEEEGKEGKASC